MKNQGEALVHSTEKMLKDYGDKVPAADKGVVETGACRSQDRAARRGQGPHQAKGRRHGAGLDEARRSALSGKPGRSRRGRRWRPSEGGDGKENVVDVDFEEVKDDDSKKSA